MSKQPENNENSYHVGWVLFIWFVIYVKVSVQDTRIPSDRTDEEVKASPVATEQHLWAVC